MFDKRCRTAVERSLKPVGSGIGRTGISANQLTFTGLLISAAAGYAIAQGELIWGAILLALSAVPDLLDGAVAKASGTASPRGAFFDSVVDRVSDTLVLGGMAWYLAGSHGGHVAVLPLAVVGASNLVSYERARAESLGFTARGGLMERAERMLLTGLALMFSSVMIPVLWLLLGLTTFTAVHRFQMVWQQATPSASRDGEAAGRWRTWKPGVNTRNGRERTAAAARQRWRTRRATASRPATWRRARTRP